VPVQSRTWIGFGFGGSTWSTYWTVQYVDQVEPPNPNPIQVRDWTGTRIPLHAVSSGQVFLAQIPGPVMARYLAEPLEAFTPRTLTDACALL